MAVNQITSKDQFYQLLQSGKVVFIDFYADWCGPCKIISPTFEALATTHAREDAVEFYKLNIDDVPDAAAEARISSIPAFHAFKNGQSLGKVVGASPPALTTLVQTHRNA